jgi:hypothetical protein
MGRPAVASDRPLKRMREESQELYKALKELAEDFK